MAREIKDRIVYFDAKTKVHIENYLSTRMDSSEALFVSSKAPHERLQIGGVEALLRKLGRELDLGRVHPHKFRRTLATKAIDKGMPIEQVQVLLGHEKNRHHIKVRNGRPAQRQSIPPQIPNLNFDLSTMETKARKRSCSANGGMGTSTFAISFWFRFWTLAPRPNIC